MTPDEKQKAAFKLRRLLCGYTDFVQADYFEDVQKDGFLLYLKVPGKGGKDFARVELIDRGDGWFLWMEPVEDFKKVVAEAGFSPVVDDLEVPEPKPDSQPVRRIAQ